MTVSLIALGHADPVYVCAQIDLSRNNLGPAGAAALAPAIAVSNSLTEVLAFLISLISTQSYPPESTSGVCLSTARFVWEQD